VAATGVLQVSSQVEDLLDGGFIERYHIKGQRMLTRQSVAEHSWRMAAVLFYLWPDARPQLINATLFHDVSERVTGDMPANIKRANPAMALAVNEVSTAEEVRLGIRFFLHPEEVKVLSWLDRYEGALHCADELEMGNRKILGTLLRYLRYAGDPGYALLNPEREVLRMELYTSLAKKVSALINYEEEMQ
jgi:5'-deoxynucleotidase YfbR-like HD superfamily hydrolase